MIIILIHYLYYIHLGKSTRTHANTHTHTRTHIYTYILSNKYLELTLLEIISLYASHEY